MSNHTFSTPRSYTADPEFDHAVRFAIDRRDAGLIPMPNASGSHVVTVGESSDWEQVAEVGAAQFLGHVPNLGVPIGSAVIRSALRGSGRDRDRR